MCKATDGLSESLDDGNHDVAAQFILIDSSDQGGYDSRRLHVRIRHEATFDLV